MGHWFVKSLKGNAMAPTPCLPTSGSSARYRSVRLLAAGLASTVIFGFAISPVGVANAAAKKVAVKAATKDIVDTAVGAGSFKTLVTAVQAAGLVDTLKGAGPFTVFAPTDAAFAKLPKATLDGLLADKKALAEILTYHVVAGKVLASDVVKLNGQSAATVNGAKISIAVAAGKVTLNGNVNVVKTDVLASNGVIHVIDTVLLPPAAPKPVATTPPTTVPALKDIVDTAVANGSFKTLVAAVSAAGLVDTLKSAGPFTVFAPTDEAFAKIPKATLDGLLADKKALTDVLTYHVVAGKVLAADVVKLNGQSAKTVNGASVAIAVVGGKVTLNGNVNVVLTDVLTSNGVIHVIDAVLLPPAAAPAASTSSVKGNIVDVAVADGRFKTLAAALSAAGLVDTLKGAGPFTVLAPTDAAFTILPKETLASLLKPENKKLLTDILTYHVIPGKVTAADIIKKHDYVTVNGKVVRVRLANGLVYIGGAQVLITDVAASNGIIHVIDTVLIP
jgi:transforming growth factor-beta-induced protein